MNLGLAEHRVRWMELKKEEIESLVACIMDRIDQVGG